MLTERPAELLSTLQRTFPTWHCVTDGGHVILKYGKGAQTHRPSRQPPSWSDMLTRVGDTCADYGIQRVPPLPVHGLGDAELTFSAVQGLDPYLKHGQRYVYAHGFIPQPVVRFTGQRDEQGVLLPGFATSFINVSIVEPIETVGEHASLINAWVGVLSRLGFHAQQVTISGSLGAWCRGPIAGITLRFHHEGRELGDAVLLWNRADPSKLATDIGSGLERLAWLLTHRNWASVVYGTFAEQADVRVLDAVRTATLIVGSGIRPAAHGPGNAARRLLRREAAHTDRLGVSRVVRWAHAYWSRVQQLSVPWPEVCRILETEMFGQPPDEEAP